MIDASAIVPVLAGESWSARAGKWFAAQDHLDESVTVDLFDAECASALWKRVRRAHWSVEDAERALGRALALPFSRIALGDVVADALRLSLRLDTTVYDACYVALAVASGLPLVTADRRLARAARKAGCDALCFTEEV